MNQDIETMSVNAIRVLSADAIQKANSGHPGLPLGVAPMAYEIWAHYLHINPKDPKWENRDRFVLSGGHGSMLLYSLLHLFGFGLTKEDLMSIPGIGEVKAVKILSLAEISRRLVREQAARRLVFSSPSSVADYYMEDLRHLETETAILVLLDNKLALLREEILSLGTVNCTLLSPREIFLRALRWGAVNIMLLHNHPSGDPTPSRMDLEVTERISRVGKLLGIHLIDHLVIGDLSYTSLREYGCITDRDPAADSGAEWTQEEPVADSDAAHAERKQRDPVPGSDDSGAQQTREDRIYRTGEADIFDTD